VGVAKRAQQIKNEGDWVSSTSGTVPVVAAGSTLKVLARNALGEAIIATPAIAGHKLYVRTRGHLWAFGKSQ
jgi:hypothetical protein